MSVVAESEYTTCSLESCGKPIMRNLANFDGHPYHFGCLKLLKQFGRAVAICQACFSWLTEDFVTEVNFQDGPIKTKKTCGVCGSQELHCRPIPRSHSND